MTREEREIIEAIKSMGYDRTAYPREKVSAVISMAIEALSADTISREEAIHAIDLCRERKNKEIDELRTKWLEAEQRADRPKGEWVLSDNPNIFYECSNCGHGFPYNRNGKSTVFYFQNFCPNCGAKMGGDGE